MTGLYIHVPLCIARCRYCDFYKLTPDEWDDMARFIDCLELELQRLPDTFAPKTVFIGGGTPTALDAEQLESLLGMIGRTVDLSRVSEFSCESNPGTLTTEKLEVLQDGGVNRMSIGIQSFNDKALRLLGRIHTAEQAYAGFRLLRDVGFDNINVDLIQSIPGMNRADILADVRQVVELRPEHISYYNLIYEPGTPMTRERDAGRILPPGDEEEAATYHAVRSRLAESGYGHYEISNFCRPGRESLQNRVYWQGRGYFGCGPSAHSHWQGARYGNVRDLQDYCHRLEAGQRPFDAVERLDASAKARETLVMWLRMTDGVVLTEFEQLTGFPVDALCGAAINQLIEEELLQRTEERLALTPQALFISDAVFSELV